MKPLGFDLLATQGAAHLDVVRAVRYVVLREPLGMSFEETLFAGDESPSTQHWIAYAQGGPIGCLTLLIPDAGDSVSASVPFQVQLRGMAVLRGTQGQGVGSHMLAEVHQSAIRHGWQLWCNARQTAVPFYVKNGWRVRGQAFDIPKIGLHFAMHWEPRE